MRYNRTARSRIFGPLLLVMLSACGDLELSHFSTDAYPEKLSDWELIEKNGTRIKLNKDAIVYALNTDLFSDYSQKLRTISIPDGQAASYDAEETFGFPVGTIISKTFFYPIDVNDAVLTQSSWSGDPEDIDTRFYRLIETRLLVRQTHGWDALPYIWSDNDAYLSVTGALKHLLISSGEYMDYLVPSKNQCASCHATNHTDGKILPIGPKARHLNRDDPVNSINQIHGWQDKGKLSGVMLPAPANAMMGDYSVSLEHRARSYLDINCGHCHNPHGSADTSGLLLDYNKYTPFEMGVCKPPIAAGSGSGGRFYSIVPGFAEHSILSYRLRSTNPAAMMPELGRSLVHKEGAALVDQWINSMSGECL